MKKINVFILLFFISLVSNLFGTDTDIVLENTEKFFIFMKNRDYISIFNNLTKKSQETIVSEVIDALDKKRVKVSKEEVFSDFAEGGDTSKAYWNAFLQNFDPDLALLNSKWDIGNCKENYCEIVLQYKKSKKSAILKIFKENGIWKVGLVETFWTRKR